MKISNAAVAAAAALALTFSGTAVAGAEETESTPALSAALSSGGSSAVGDETNADDRVTGEDLLGETRADDTNPEWATMWRDTTELLGIGAVVGGMIAFANYLQFLASNR